MGTYIYFRKRVHAILCYTEIVRASYPKFSIYIQINIPTPIYQLQQRITYVYEKRIIHEYIFITLRAKRCQQIFFSDFFFIHASPQNYTHTLIQKKKTYTPFVMRTWRLKILAYFVCLLIRLLFVVVHFRYFFFLCSPRQRIFFPSLMTMHAIINFYIYQSSSC